MGAVHDAIRRLKHCACRICSFDNKNERTFLVVTREMEFPKTWTPSNEVVTVCEVCYKALRTYNLLLAHWDAEKKRNLLKAA